MGTLTEKAKLLRPLIEKAVASLNDEDAEVATDLFPKWTPDLMDFKIGDRVRYKGQLYKCILDHTSQESWTPTDAPSIWVRTSDPAIEYPDWLQPTGSHDAYAINAKVTHNNKKWISTVDNNVWEPGVYGWNEVTE